MKKFFERLEERFFFPIGRRTWQILSFVAMAAIATCIFIVAYTFTPTSRDEVVIDKTEVVSNRPTSVQHSVSIPEKEVECSGEDYKRYVDSLRMDLDFAEWQNLGDSIDGPDEYLVDDYGNFLQDPETGWYLKRTTRIFQANEDAVPTSINRTFESWGLDSADFCPKIQFIKSVHFLCSHTEKSFLKDVWKQYFQFLAEFNNINSANLEEAWRLRRSVDLTNSVLDNNKSLERYGKYLDYIISHNCSSEKLTLVTSLLKKHSELVAPKYSRENYFDLAKVILSNSMELNDLAIAVESFSKDMEYYDKHKLEDSLRKYLDLYALRLEEAKAKQNAEQMEKYAHRIIALLTSGGAFLAIVLIATILLLFSIQSMMRKHLNQKE